MKTKKVISICYGQVREIANEHGLDTVELTSGMNGYPRNLRLAITGFATFEAAEKFAKMYNGDVTSIRKCDGWHFWQSQGWQIEGYDNGATSYREDVWTHQIAVEFDGAEGIVDLEDLGAFIDTCNDYYDKFIMAVCKEHGWEYLDIADEQVASDGDSILMLGENGTYIVEADGEED